jgi:predicted extracellular nuclease
MAIPEPVLRQIARRLGMSIAALSRQATNACSCHVDADEPGVLDYDTEQASEQA